MDALWAKKEEGHSERSRGICSNFLQKDLLSQLLSCSTVHLPREAPGWQKSGTDRYIDLFFM